MVVNRKKLTAQDSALRPVETDRGMIDVPYLVLTVLLVVIGLIMLFSASYARAYYKTGNSAKYFISQLMFAVMGMGVLFLFSRIPYEWYQKLSLLILFVAVAILALVPLIGIEVGGATRWISLGFTRFQPSEIAKFAVITSFAAIMAAHTRDMKGFKYGFAPYMLILGVIAIILGVLFENQNIAFMVGLAFAIAASCNFPIILLSMYWSKLTTRGAMLGGWLGLITAVVLMILGPTIWVQILGHEKAIFPYEYPALFSISVAFLGIWFFSATDNSAEGARERELFRAQFIRSPTGFGVEQGRAH